MSTIPDELHDLIEYEVACAWLDGYAAGRAAVDAELVTALAEALSAGQTTDYREAVAIHHQIIDARTRRTAADRGELAA